MSRIHLAMRYGLAILLWIAALFVVFLIVFVLSRGLALLFGTDRAIVDAGVIATFTGVAGGVPVALLIGRLLDAERRRLAALAREGQRMRLLKTIQRDLLENLAQLVERDRSEATIPYLRTDVWTTLSVSGELALVDDPDLLDVLARAYHRIATISELEREIWEAFHDPAQWTHRVERGTGKDMTGRLRQSLEAAVRNQDPHAKAAIDGALGRLARELDEPPPQNGPLKVDRPRPKDPVEPRAG